MIIGALGCIGAWTAKRLVDEGTGVVAFRSERSRSISNSHLRRKSIGRQVHDHWRAGVHWRMDGQTPGGRRNRRRRLQIGTLSFHKQLSLTEEINWPTSS